MEAYFQYDPRVQEWLNQIMEKIFTVCILTGADSEAEFQSGCQIVVELTSLLQEIPTIPSEFLADGVKQLLEQQLPSTRVISNFPTFQATMDRMLREGIFKAIDTKKGEYNSLIPNNESDKEINVKLHKCNIEESQEEFMTESVIPAHVQADAQVLEEELAQLKANAQVLEEELARSKADAQVLEEGLAQSKADAQVLEEELAQLKADAQVLEEGLAQSKADAHALAEALEQADAQAKADAHALEETLAQAKAVVQALADALAQTEVQAKVDIQSLEDALAQAEAQAKFDIQSLEDALAQTEAQAKVDIQSLEDALAQAEAQAKADIQSLEDAFAQAEAQAKSVADVERHEPEPMPSANDNFIEYAPMTDNTNETGTELEPDVVINDATLVTPIQSNTSSVLRSSYILEQLERLKCILSNIFPKGTVQWNMKIMEHTFLAQVEDILICLHDPERPCQPKEFNKVGWKVLVCSTEDLTFPRRIERGIRQIQRTGKKSSTV